MTARATIISSPRRTLAMSVVRCGAELAGRIARLAREEAGGGVALGACAEFELSMMVSLS